MLQTQTAKDDGRTSRRNIVRLSNGFMEESDLEISSVIFIRWLTISNKIQVENKDYSR